MFRTLLREAFRTSKAQPTASIVTLLLIIGMTVAILLTSGRTLGIENRVLNAVDSLGSRTMVFAVADSAQLDPHLVRKIAQLDSVEWVGAFADTYDVRAVGNPGGQRVSLRRLVTADTAERPNTPETTTAYASRKVLNHLGLSDSWGRVTGENGDTHTVIERPSATAPIRALGDVIVAESGAAGFPHIQQVRVTVKTPAALVKLQPVIRQMVRTNDPKEVTLLTDDEHAELQEVLSGELGTHARSLLLGLLSMLGAILAVVIGGMTLNRRREFGRRRALGAKRSTIVTLLLTQTLMLSTVGAGLGSAIGTVALIASRNPLPSVSFIVALAVLTVFVAQLAALTPALIASRRDPIRELRVA